GSRSPSTSADHESPSQESRMSSLSRPVASLALAVTLASGCTFNVTAFEREVESESDASLTRLTADFEGSGVPVDGNIVVRGTERAGVAARVTLAGLVGGSDDPDEIARGLAVSWPSDEDLVTELRIDHAGIRAESVWVQRLELDVPIGVALDLSTGGAS